jgi:hypothetical protein
MERSLQIACAVTGGAVVARTGMIGKYQNKKRIERDMLLRSRPISGRDIFRREEHIRIAPKHPGMGRR